MNTYGRTLNPDIIPLQPDIKWRTVDLKQKLIKWNPYAQKNLALFFQFETNSDPNALEIIPDGCINFFFRCDDSPFARVSGLTMKNEARKLTPHTVYFGVKPYSMQGIKRSRTPWGETVNQMVDFSNIFSDCSIVEEISQSKSFEDRIALFENFSKKYLIDENYLPDLVEYSEIIMCKAKGNLKIDDLSNELGYTSRHCREKFKSAIGISIKQYNEILRFQNAVRMMENQSNSSAADIIFENNYYDQSHFIREFKKFTNMTPVDFRKHYMCRNIS